MLLLFLLYITFHFKSHAAISGSCLLIQILSLRDAIQKQHPNWEDVPKGGGEGSIPTPTFFYTVTWDKKREEGFWVNVLTLFKSVLLTYSSNWIKIGIINDFYQKPLFLRQFIRNLLHKIDGWKGPNFCGRRGVIHGLVFVQTSLVPKTLFWSFNALIWWKM